MNYSAAFSDVYVEKTSEHRAKALPPIGGVMMGLALSVPVWFIIGVAIFTI